MTDDEFLVLNSVYLRKIATAAVVAECSALSAGVIATSLEAAAERGDAFDVGEGQYMLSDEGTQAVLTEYSSRYGDLRAGGEIEEWYQKFEVLNGQFLKAISAWQENSSDDSALDRLLRLVSRQVKALGTITGTVDRYAIYRDRFERALQRVDEGKQEFVVSPSVDSIHNIWFEFHEDVLTLLGRPRDVAEAEAGR